MPSNVRRFCTLIFVAALAAAAVPAQSPPPTTTTSNLPIIKAPTSGDVMRDRISKAKAFIAVRNYNAAIYELENIRRESSDVSVNAVSVVLLMNCFLEQGDYKRAADLITDLYNQQKTTKAGAGALYAAVSAQVVKGARSQVERYRGLGLTVADRNLPLEAVNDIERMRETLELVVTQAREMASDSAKAAAAMTMLEEATTARSALARDEYDARRWRDAIVDSREQLANSRSVITNAVDGTVARPASSAPAAPTLSAPLSQPAVSTTDRAASAQLEIRQPEAKPSDSQVAVVEKQSAAPIEVPQPAASPRDRLVPNIPIVETSAQKSTGLADPAKKADADTSPLEVGSLIAFATKQTTPIYPSAAKSIRASGVVKVEVIVDEAGQVVEVQKATGPPMLQSAARDAIRKWKFKPFTRDGQPVRAAGFVNFSFSL